MTNPASGTENQKRFAPFQFQYLVQSAQCRQGIARHDTRLFDAEFFGNRRHIVGLHSRIFRVETTFGIDESQRVCMVSFLEATDLSTDRSNGSRPVRTKDIGKSRGTTEDFGKFTFAFEWIPDTHTGGFDAQE